MEFVKVERPLDWPQNNREVSIERILEGANEFISEPTFENRKVLVNLVNQNDLNEHNSNGLLRITEYEISIINSIYLMSLMMQFRALKSYLYRHVALLVYQSRSTLIFGFRTEEDIVGDPAISGLTPSLKLFFIIYFYCRTDKDKTFAESLYYYVDRFQHNDELFSDVQYCFTQLLLDLSETNSFETMSMFKFSRDELMKLMKLQAKMLSKAKINPFERPHRGVLNMMIANWILKSRYDYKEGYVYKCLGNDAIKSTLINNQMWMNEINNLNDKREIKSMIEIFSRKAWHKKNWSKNVDLSLVRTYYVSSFCKQFPTDEMRKKYGNNVIGFKTDNIGDLIAPIYLRNTTPFFTQVVSFDILYDRDEFMKEINYLEEVIDLFDVDDSIKRDFFESIIQYWILSFKDKKWSYERERRYILFMYPEYDYIESIQEGGFLKVKTSVLTYPDIAMVESNFSDNYHSNLYEKARHAMSKDMFFCNNCLQNWVDPGLKDIQECEICHSKDIMSLKVV